jgi:hypothetical protein
LNDHKPIYPVALCAVVAVLCLTYLYGLPQIKHSAAKPAGGRIYAQKLVEDIAAVHPELGGVEIASTPPDKRDCVTIASTEAKEIGERCDNDELSVLSTNEPFVEKEQENGKEVLDVTVAIHQADGKTIATAGIDFKPKANLQQAEAVQQARRIGQELEGKFKYKNQLFEPAQ